MWANFLSPISRLDTMPQELQPNEELSESPGRSPHPDRPSREQRFVARSVQSIVRWSPLGGSSAAFATFLVQQEWVMAGLLLPVTAVSGVWAAYSQHFVERLTEIYADRARRDADSLVAWMDSLNEALKWQFSGFDYRYLRLQAKPCQEYATDGFNPDRTAIPMLEEVFVPLRLSGYGFSPEGNLTDIKFLSGQKGDFSEEVDIWELLRRSRKDPNFRQLIIQARGGFGKTTLLRHIALIYGEGKHGQGRYKAPKRIPFLLRLRDWREQLTQAQIPHLPDLITNHYLPSLAPDQPLQPPPNWANHLLLEGKALIMLDGFDEVPETERQRVSHWISAQMQTYKRSTFIVTSRPAGYADYVAQRPKTPLFVKKFNPADQRKFIRDWYLCQEQVARSERYRKQAQAAADLNAERLIDQLHDPQRPELQTMAENPLLLNMLATFHRFDPGIELPRRRVELYQGMIKLQLEDRPKARGIPMLLPFEKSQRVLQALALAMVKHNRPQITQQQALNFLQQQQALQAEEVDPAAWLQQIVQVSELLLEREQDTTYEFAHLSFQGYFAATWLAQNNGLKLVLENWQHNWWRETILLYTAQLPLTQWIRSLHAACDLGADAAQLAYDCLRDYRNPNKIPAALKQQIAALSGQVDQLRYQQLETFLIHQQWQEADEETYRLMITTVGKDVGEYFTQDELLNFPCAELKAIDDLWVHHSKGRFGFSVQKQLYLECGGIPDGHYYRRAWNKFCHANGWNKIEDQYVNVTYYTLAPKGHLPHRLLLICGFELRILFSRIETCKV